MLVVSGVELGRGYQAAEALPPPLIGKILTVAGCGGTIKRATGMIVEISVDDPVFEGDIIDTAAGGRIGIRFVDGTLFNLSDAACLELREFVCSTDGGLFSTVFILTRGTFAFIAGPLANTDSLRIDTPFGGIRCRANAGGMGILSLAALVFSTIEAVHAADPNVTILDDDNITYKDLEHGVFELITKEAIPRHIIVEDPGETVVLSRKGSSVSVNQLLNSATRMEELQAAQQDVLANYTKGLGEHGSGTPPFTKSLPLLQPINFVQPDDPAAQKALEPLPILVIFKPDVIFTAKPPPPPPSLILPAAPIEIDTLVFDTFAVASGTFSASSSVGNATLTFGISGGTAGITVLGGVTYDLSDTGPFGTLYLNSTSGAFTFVPNSAAINALLAPTTESFTITVSDGQLSTAQLFVVTLNGINDAALVSGTAAGSVVEAGGFANATRGTLTASGTLTDTDVDNPPNTFAAVSTPMKSIGGFGTFTITAAGVWTYTLDNANGAVQALNVGDKLIDTFTVTTIDGTPQSVTITIDGANDAAIIAGTIVGSVIEAGGASSGTTTASGTLTDADVDNTPDSFAAVNSPTKSTGGYGTFSITAAGVWTYTLDNANGAVQALNAGDKLTDTFTVMTIDGTAQVVTITINGTDDAAVISGSTTGVVVEAGGVANATPGTLTATGTLTDTDVDNTPNTFAAISSPTKSAGGYGTFTMTAAGVWTYTLDNANSAVQALNVGDKLIDTFTVTSIDGTPQSVTITIAGANDAAIIAGTTAGSVVEAGGDSPGLTSANGTLSDTDIDNTPDLFIAVSSPTASDGGFGDFTMAAGGMWTYTLDNNNSVVDALNAGDTLTDTFTVHTIDGTAQVVTIDIHGANDADPNDFDNLALGTVVVTDSPFVFGTPGKDSIAGGGDVPQTIYGGAGEDTLNGTGVVDTIYGGSGNDTIKGNNGDDTIYGGSGSDTINGSNGNDTIIGGFGADFITGGNGSDRFVYLSVADSRAGRFDTITDFESGSDKIDLTALGALAFAILALSPSSTLVPAHTIAWIYDSAANETIVYVNPTDHTLGIGDSSLLEVHLQGIATIDASDFIFDGTTASLVLAAAPVDLAVDATLLTDGGTATNTADISTASASANGALVADSSWTEQVPTSLGYGFDDAEDHVGLVDYAKSADPDDVQLRLTEDADHDPAIIVTDDKSIGAHHVHATALHFAFDQLAVTDNAGDGNALGGIGSIFQDPISAAIAALNAPEPAIKHGAGVKGDNLAVPLHGNTTVDSEAAPDVAPEKENHGASKNVDNHGHATNAEPNAEINSELLKTSEAGAGNHSMSAEEKKQSSPPGQDAGTHPAASPTIHAASGSEALPHELGDSFHFNSAISEGLDAMDHGRSSRSTTSIEVSKDIASLMGQDGSPTIDLPVPDLIDSSDGHSDSHGSVHMTHDLIV